MEFSPAFHVAKCRQQCRLLATPPSILEKPQSAGLLPCMALLTLPKMIECEVIREEKLLTLSCGIQFALKWP